MKTRRIISILFAGMFGLFAYWQWNDPDGALWAAIYLAAGAMCLMPYRTRASRWLAYLSVAGLVAAGIWLLPPSLTGWIDIEEAREGFGLIICAVVTGGFALNPVKTTPRPTRQKTIPE